MYKSIRAVLEEKFYFSDDENFRDNQEQINEALSQIAEIIDKSVKIMPDYKIKDSPNTNYARAYYQGKFDTLMEVIAKIKEE